MDSWGSSSITESIQNKLKQIVIQCIEEYDGECDFKQKVHHKVNERMFGFARSSSFEFGISSDFELKNSRCEVCQYTNGVKGKITFEY